MEFIFSGLAILVAALAYLLSAYQRKQMIRPVLVFQELEFEEEGKERIGFYISNIGAGAAVNLEIPNEQVHREYIGLHGAAEHRGQIFRKFYEIPRDVSPGGQTLIHREEAPDRRFLVSGFEGLNLISYSAKRLKFSVSTQPPSLTGRNIGGNRNCI